ncbi:hypothetical protein L3Y34_018486 [Caenorhabditis briggsae]|uniref:Uncharacterized protein n=1 Tax=Caenorhabditis briggsae TaxID=6238 RepID=A0AAE9DKU2_CAEBR|nr:hypothetical protein L3Y34_018486 [Caenorhabditis briggsae]
MLLIRLLESILSKILMMITSLIFSNSDLKSRS